MKIKKYLWIAAILLSLGFVLWPVPDLPPVRYIDRESGEVVTEKIPAEGWLKWLYYNPAGELTLELLVKRKVVSALYGYWMNRPGSARKIAPFVGEFDIDLRQSVKQDFESFNDFFTRELKPGLRPVDTAREVVVSPADGKVLVWQNAGKGDFIVKGSRFDIAGFLRDEELASIFENGTLMLFRLSPPDYHRFHFPVDGRVIETLKINGNYYSVNPIAIRDIIEIFWENKREWTLIETEEFGKVIMAEIGATMVGSIIQTYQSKVVKKGDEKGYFMFGGSSVVLLFEPGRVCGDEDLILNTENGMETSVEMGRRVAVACPESI
ncbi:MAG: phosphatidylserine decarboxylase [Bacteroidales bacterium]